MYEQLILLQGHQAMAGQLILLAGAGFFLVLGAVMLLLLSSDRTRARGYEFSSRRKLGHEFLTNKKPVRGFWKRMTGQDRIKSEEIS